MQINWKIFNIGGHLKDNRINQINILKGTDKL